MRRGNKGGRRGPVWPHRTVLRPGALMVGSPGPGVRRKRVERTGLEILLLMVLVLACAAAAWAQSGGGKSWAAAPIAATVTVVAPSKDLPAEIAELEIEVKQLAPLPLRGLVGLVADLTGVEASIQERPGACPGRRSASGAACSIRAFDEGNGCRLCLTSSRVCPATTGAGRTAGFSSTAMRDIEQRRPERVPGGISVDVLAAVAGRDQPETREGDDAEGTDRGGACGV